MPTILMQSLALMNTQATGLPPGLFEFCGLDHWKMIRNVTQPAFSKTKLTKVIPKTYTLH